MRSELALSDSQIPRIIEKGHDKPVKWNGIVLQPTDGHYHTATRKSLKRIGLEGLHLKLNHGSEAKAFFSNSPHKIMHKGSNADDFYFSEITDYISLVSELLGIPYWDARLIGRFEFAVNLIEDNPSSLINDLDTLKNKPFDMMKGKNGKIYGKQSQIAAMKTKFYNVYLKDKLSGMLIPTCENNVLRIENVTSISYLKKKGIKLNTMADLSNECTMKQIGALLTDSMEHITFMGSLPSSATYQELEAYYFFKYAKSQEIKNFQKHNRRTFMRHRALYKKLEESKSERINDLPERVADKWLNLSSN